MSEFVECQQCGRKFFASNLECPYCAKAEKAAAAAGNVVPLDAARPKPSLLGIVFGSFHMLLLGIAVFSLLEMPRLKQPGTRQFLAFQAPFALATFAGMVGRRRWGRWLAILFILTNAGLGVWALLRRGQGGALAWGPGPIALLLFLIPLLGPQARERYAR